MLRHFSYHKKTLLLMIKIVLEIISREKKDILYSFAPSFKIFPTLIFVQTSHDLSARLKLLNLTCKYEYYKIMILFCQSARDCV